MNSKDLLINNLMDKHGLASIREISKKIHIPTHTVLNWSSNRSFPSLEQLDHIAYILNVEPYLLIKESVQYTIESPVWREGVRRVFIENIDRFRLECGIIPSYFEKELADDYVMTYRNFMAYTNGKRKKVYTVSLDSIAKILTIKPYKLLESPAKKCQEVIEKIKNLSL